MAPKKQVKNKAAGKCYKLPNKISAGQILSDVIKKKWIIGKSIGQGGFGEIYMASDIIDRPVSDSSAYVIKIEPHGNGPLFTEMHCYMRIGKPEMIENWMKTKNLKHLGMPKYLGSGSHEYKGEKYRFLVMERFGEDLQKIINKNHNKLSFKLAFQLAIQILDVLEYIHSFEYIHADIKASNLLVGYTKSTFNKIYLVDYGLACRYAVDGQHKEYKYDQRKAHNGTIEFTSRDAHIGAHSRRGDLEILGYNLIQWLCGKLPWEDNLTDCNYVANKKREMMENIPKFMKICFPSGIPPGVQEYIGFVAKLTFDENPNYGKLKSILLSGLKRKGFVDDGKLVFKSLTPKASGKRSASIAAKKNEESSDSEEETEQTRTVKKTKETPQNFVTDKVKFSQYTVVKCSTRSLRSNAFANGGAIPSCSNNVSQAKFLQGNEKTNKNGRLGLKTGLDNNKNLRNNTGEAKNSLDNIKNPKNNRVQAKTTKSAKNTQNNENDSRKNSEPMGHNPTPAMLALMKKFKK